jgi:hypothetical protein
MKRAVIIQQESLFSATAHTAEKNFRWFTPEWSCLAIIDRFFPGLSSKDLVCDAGTGKGAFLKAIPTEIPALGVEINETHSAIAEAETGRAPARPDLHHLPVTFVAPVRPLSAGLTLSFPFALVRLSARLSAFMFFTSAF